MLVSDEGVSTCGEELVSRDRGDILAAGNANLWLPKTRGDDHG
jgi:hypothetical protein